MKNLLINLISAIASINFVFAIPQQQEPQPEQQQHQEEIPVEPQQSNDPYFADDCALLRELYTEWNQAALVTWTNEIGACCDDKSIVCDPHHGYKRIAELKLRSRNFVGNIPPKITKLKYLNYLSLADNQLTGEIPQNIDELIYLTKFSFRNNNLSGKIPDSVGNIDGIFHLDFSGNKFSGEIPQSFGNLKQLQFLNLSANNLEGYIPENFRGLKKLTTFQMKNNNLQGYVPLVDSIANCTYENTNLCYQSGAICKSTAHQCSEEEIKQTREKNGYNNYKEDNTSSSCKCNCSNGSTGDANKKGVSGFFRDMGLVTKIILGVVLLAIIGSVVYLIMRKRNKNDMSDSHPSRSNYINYS